MLGGMASDWFVYTRDIPVTSEAIPQTIRPKSRFIVDNLCPDEEVKYLGTVGFLVERYFCITDSISPRCRL